jgi:hypothetical protein
MNILAGKGWKQTRRAQKFGNVKVTTTDGTFDSQKEHRRWCELKLLQRGGVIRNLEHHVPISIDVNGHHICKYIADFVYFEGDVRIYEDVKGNAATITDVFRLKRKLIRALYGVEIRIT